MRIVARQRVSALLEPVFVGAICLILAAMVPWLIRPFSWWILLLSAWFAAGGTVFIVAGVRGWRPEGIGLVLSKRGLWWRYGKLHFIRWEYVLGTKAVRWTDEGNAQEGLLVGVTHDAPLDPRVLSLLSNLFKKQFGPLPWKNVILLHDPKWQWNPKEVQSQIEASVADLSIRDQWGKETPPLSATLT
jgi:hypothetical protein